jgi:hypothetical protein
MTAVKPTLELANYLEVVQQAKGSLALLTSLEEARKHNDNCPPLSSVMALHIICDLYSELSSDEANINRITTNLEAAADDLLMIGKLIRSLAK